jgi:hypothetical protein
VPRLVVVLAVVAFTRATAADTLCTVEGKIVDAVSGAPLRIVIARSSAA